ncbi:hypothetical protein L9F63_010644, partial [Diploptera punctata]
GQFHQQRLLSSSLAMVTYYSTKDSQPTLKIESFQFSSSATLALKLFPSARHLTAGESTSYFEANGLRFDANSFYGLFLSNPQYVSLCGGMPGLGLLKENTTRMPQPLNAPKFYDPGTKLQQFRALILTYVRGWRFGARSPTAMPANAFSHRLPVRATPSTPAGGRSGPARFSKRPATS